MSPPIPPDETESASDAVPPEGLTLLAESGRFLLTGSGGVRDGIDTQTVEVDDHTEVVLTVPRVINTPGR